ncbi:CPBP family intramembrane metalloprotease [Dysgonomonas sp. 521]|uniref:CPBP family intramembrane glutamic endopeptidase n=1 Tax=Dysgonomonas sp. 521 TaxID=2302932 RepID=UPI0013D11385|nr:CPBP family intramembrane glutamic endopeptidase [Dysgonomonas sp. 521]NDV96584.1 CPBP family intramembrane metalloprotease [Dysgonomonas sp. 521]
MDKDNKGILYGMGGWSQLFFFIFLAVSGLMLTVFILALSGHAAELEQSVKAIRLASTIQSVCFFIMPSLVFAFLCHENAKIYLKTEDPYRASILILGICLIVVIQPLVDFISYYNQQMVLPEFMAGVENWMKANELAAEKTTTLLFADKTISGLILNLLIIAIVAGLAEELFFRGCIQQIIQKIVGNQHLAVWLGAFVFSAMHFQFYGFFPRLLLGALLGYLFIWAGSIWVPVIVHTVNNMIGVVLAYLFYGTPKYEELATFNLDQNLWITSLSLILTVIITLFIYKKRILSFKDES